MRCVVSSRPLSLPLFCSTHIVVSGSVLNDSFSPLPLLRIIILSLFHSSHRIRIRTVFGRPNASLPPFAGISSTRGKPPFSMPPRTSWKHRRLRMETATTPPPTPLPCPSPYSSFANTPFPSQRNRCSPPDATAHTSGGISKHDLLEETLRSHPIPGGC